MMEEERVMKKNKLFVGVICLLVLVSITGCGKKTNLSIYPGMIEKDIRMK